ncbi:MAG: hypothetical protein DPW09_11575 [Anaerolineae bacterium]|nr:hypothetical protein [Anaerolineae bacterium]
MTRALRAATPATSFNELTPEDDSFAPISDKVTPPPIGQKTTETPTPPPLSHVTPPPPLESVTRPEPTRKPTTAWWAGGIAVGAAALFGLLICGLIGLWLFFRPSGSSTSTPTTIVKVTPTSTAPAQSNPDNSTSGQATAIANSVLVFEDDFNSNVNGWDEDEGNDTFAKYKTQVSDGKYRISIHSNQGVIHRESPANLQSKDFQMSVEATVVEADAGPGEASIALGFRENAQGDYYALEFYNNGMYKLSVRKDEKWKMVQQGSSSKAFSLSPGVSNVFGVTAVGSTFTFYANEQKLDSVTDATLTGAGEVALAVSLNKKDQVLAVDFDNLRVKEIPLGQSVAEIQATATARAEAIAAGQAAPTATAAARLAVIEAAPIVFQDDFASNANNWPEGPLTDDGSEITRQITNGAYRISIKTPDDYFNEEFLPGFSAKDFYLETTATVVEDPSTPGKAEVDLILRRAGNGNRYAVSFYSNSTYGFYVNQNGEWKTLQKFPASNAFRLKPGSTNTFGVYASGSSFILYANGQELATVKDIALSEVGEVGLAIGQSEANQSITVDFDNFIIKNISGTPAPSTPIVRQPTPAGLTKTIVADDGQSQLDVPGDWKKLTNINDVAQLQAGQPQQGLYAMVIGESKAFFADMTLEGYAKLILDNNFSKLESSTVSSPETITLDGHQAVQYRIDGTIQGIKATYILVIVEGSDKFFQIIAYTAQSEFDRKEGILRQVIASFKELP